MINVIFIIVILTLLQTSFGILTSRITSERIRIHIKKPSFSTYFELYMGRAANVRAATKARTDGAKAKNNNRFAKAIINVVKQSGPDPESNRNLAALLADAKAANVPNDVIKRNIEKASSAQTTAFKESMFEFIGPGGSFMLVNVLTDNDNRASSEVALVGKKQSLKSSNKGSVAFNFIKKARLDTTKIDEDKLMELCLECGVDDYELRTKADGSQLNPSEDGMAAIYVNLGDMVSMRDALRAAGYVVETSIRNVPKDSLLALSDNEFDAFLAASDAFLALEDVDTIEHNVDLNEGDE